MLPAEVLAIWSERCTSTGIDWYLYAQSLLCAEGYGSFPETLKNPQVAVFAGDMPRIIGQVLPGFPGEGSLDISGFSSETGSLRLKAGEQVILEIHLLHPVQSPEEAEAYGARAGAVRAGVRTKRKLLKLLNRVFGGVLGKWVEKKQHRIARAAFDTLLSLSGGSQGGMFFGDHLTNKNPVLLRREQLAEKTRISCAEAEYPTFSGYREYLTEVYGDYETGLFDEIGCGLTAGDKEKLKAHQARCRQTLGFVQELSREFGLRYYLLAGSVLGCVRHGGFIPWDDDIDLGIRIEDLARFEEVVKEQLPKRLPEGFQLKQCGPNNGYPRMFSKICYQGRCCIDLWPLVPTYTRGVRARLTWYFAKIITKVHYKKLGQKLKRFVRIVNVMSLFMTDKMALWFARKNERLHCNGDFTAYINLYSIYSREKETIPKAWLDTEATGNFDGLTVPVVGCTGEYLTHLYGDYMAFPPPWKRASRHVDRF